MKVNSMSACGISIFYTTFNYIYFLFLVKLKSFHYYNLIFKIFFSENSSDFAATFDDSLDSVNKDETATFDDEQLVETTLKLEVKKKKKQFKKNNYL